MPAPLHATDETFLFTTPTGRPIDEERFVEKHWHRAIRATGIRPRKFTRHTFISAALSKEANLKWVARYCGTSVEMIDEHYGKWLGDDGGQLAILATHRPGLGGATFGETFRGAPENVEQARGGRFEPGSGDEERPTETPPTTRTSGDENAEGPESAEPEKALDDQAPTRKKGNGSRSEPER